MKAEVVITDALCKECGYCIGACPKKLLETATHFNAGGFHPAQMTNPEECTGCALCYQVCPEIAIEVRKKG